PSTANAARLPNRPPPTLVTVSVVSAEFQPSRVSSPRWVSTASGGPGCTVNAASLNGSAVALTVGAGGSAAAGGLTQPAVARISAAATSNPGKAELPRRPPI